MGGNVHRKYDSQAGDELSMRPGDVLEVLEADSSGWSRGKIAKTGKSGWFPTNYTASLEPDDEEY
ncbi:SH3 domain-containing protein [Baffinella frigidus]|nr:SH3 domain-containing protein [Cryptophyta sp. CCMP2293]